MVAAVSNSSPDPTGWGWPGNKGQLKTYHLANSLLPAALLCTPAVTCYPAYLDHDGDGEGLLVRRHDHLVADGSWGTKKASAVVTWRPQACPRIMSLLSPALTSLVSRLWAAEMSRWSPVLPTVFPSLSPSPDCAVLCWLYAATGRELPAAWRSSCEVYSAVQYSTVQCSTVH